MGLKDETITFGSPSKQKQEVLWRGGYRFLLALWAVGLIYLSSTLIGEEEPLQPELDPAASQLQAKRQKTRDAGMVKNGHQLCWKNGTCHCDKGYTGDLCNTAICQQGCVHGECLFPGYCTCFDGFKGRSCEDPICRVPCQHGKCVQPNHCKCESGWFGIDCSMRCVYGTYSYPMQTCTCSEGWGGKDCNQALCEKHGCNRGSCIRPDYCHCHTGWGGQNCSIDILSDQAEEILEGLSIRQRGLRSMVIHKDDRFTSDTWRDIRKWTAHLDAQWKFGRSRFNEMVPENDTLVTHYKKRFRTCAAVGNSGSLKTVLAGAAIDMHDAVLRYNGAPTKPYEQHVGDKTTYRLLNRRVGDALLWQPTPSDSSKKKRKSRSPAWLLWRAESYHQYPNLRRKYPEENIYLLAPEFLIPVISVYKELMERIAKAGIKWSTVAQSAPHGFVGIALLIQMCDYVDVYGFDAPHPNVKIRYHYFDKVVPESPLAFEFEYVLLRVLHNFGLIRLCEVDNIEKCIHDDDTRIPRLKSGEDIDF